MSQIKKRNKSFELIICEECNLDTAVIIHEKIYSDFPLPDYLEEMHPQTLFYLP